MAYPEVDSSYFAADYSVPQTRIRALRNRDLYSFERPMQIEIAAASTSATSHATLASFEWKVPQPIVGYTASFNIEAYDSAGTGVIRLREGETPTDGADVAVAATAWGTWYTIYVTIPAARARTQTTMRVQGHGTGGSTVFIRSTEDVCFWVDHGL